MKKYTLLLMCLSITLLIQAQVFTDYFMDKTLRIDYLFTGNAAKQEICLNELSSLPLWAGRRHHLSELPLQGNGQIVMRDIISGNIIYKTSFSSLFQEWLETDEAKVVTKGFENSFLVPYPLRPAEIEITLLDPHRNIRANMKHTVNPNDILIHPKGINRTISHKYLLQSGSVDKCIDVAILAEGYTLNEMDTFYKDAAIACESLFSHEPFKSMKTQFNIIAVASPSEDSGVSVPRLGDWKRTAFNSNFSTFYSDRYLTTSHVKSIHDALAGIPYEHIIILANTEEYGGGGIYNSYTLTTAHHPQFRPVVVHEFGHSFGGLADEYFYDNDVMTDTYPLDIEPWEQNISTLKNFASKWIEMLAKYTPIPTPPTECSKYPIGVYEGAGYSAKGIYRPAYNCRMRTNEYPDFCPVCQRAIQRIIDFYTK
ncbi:IgA Peptidase M64 [Bacteroides helcogenes]|uniref:IgA peptidase n=1 Tax=Bacteroides helcogenes (strain ATCC 35417 / DSM 20613 / JCM 6297 / CCUG 15421 / P 36-108) TaxID=693979 RepID=E6ST19_BACT6|nr:IgA Peptidase M64 [Bacteroides helcogenes]ADV45223.1 IgA peptidase [Bacteroides helcogenes P 36-108]MDY5238784.1 IgA Peptidase M64 [Bacteroides helcogenes]